MFWNVMALPLSQYAREHLGHTTKYLLFCSTWRWEAIQVWENFDWCSFWAELFLYKIKTCCPPPPPFRTVFGSPYVVTRLLTVSLCVSVFLHPSLAASSLHLLLRENYKSHQPLLSLIPVLWQSLRIGLQVEGTQPKEEIETKTRQRGFLMSDLWLNFAAI